MVSRSPRPEAETEKEQSELPKFSLSGGVVRFSITVVLFLVLATSLAFYAQTLNSELSGETDEAAHYITALMIHDYVANGMGQPPMQFAADYYLHYPKVALGHWPPMFYLLQAGLMFVLGPSTSTSLILVLLTAAMLAAFVSLVVQRELGSLIAGLACGAFFLLLPLTQHYSRMVMSDMPVAAFVFAATWFWAEFMNSGRRAHAIAFALLASAAILTKGNGYALVAVGPVAIVLCRRWDLVLNRNVWLAAFITGALTIPWNVVTRSYIVPTMQYDSGGTFFLRASWFYLQTLATLAGPILPALALVGIGTKIVMAWRKRSVSPIWASLLGMMIGIHVLHSLVPAGLEIRYLIASFAALIVFMATGIVQIADWLRRSVPRNYSIPALAALVAIVFFSTLFEIPSKPAFGYDEVAGELVNANPSGSVMIVSHPDGEGLLISEVAKRDHKRPGITVVRSTQMCASMDWNGYNYSTLVRNASEAIELLDAIPVEVVVFDRRKPGHAEWKHPEILTAAVRDSSAWSRLGMYPKVRKRGTVADARIEVYRRVGPLPTKVRGLKVDLRATPKIRLNSVE